jgi:hypothetical protein
MDVTKPYKFIRFGGRRGPKWPLKSAGLAGLQAGLDQHACRTRCERSCRRSGGKATAGAKGPTLGFVIHDFWAGRKSPILGVWAAPLAPETIHKYGGRSPPYCCMVFGAPGAAQTPTLDDFRPAQKSCIIYVALSTVKNHVLKTQV